MANWETRWNEHNMPSGKWNPSQHLNNSITNHFNWSVTCTAAVNVTHKILEASIIMLLKLTLNDQIESDLLQVIKNGVV